MPLDVTQDVLTEISDDALRTTLGRVVERQTRRFRSDGTHRGLSTSSTGSNSADRAGGERFRLIREHARGGIGQVWLRAMANSNATWP